MISSSTIAVLDGASYIHHPICILLCMPHQNWLSLVSSTECCKLLATAHCMTRGSAASIIAQTYFIIHVMMGQCLLSAQQLEGKWQCKSVLTTRGISIFSDKGNLKQG